MNDVVTVMLIPVVAGTVWVVGLCWWVATGLVGAYKDVRVLIRNAKRWP